MRTKGRDEDDRGWENNGCWCFAMSDSVSGERRQVRLQIYLNI